MKSIIIIIILLLCNEVFSQENDSDKIVISDKGDRIEVQSGDTVISFSYEMLEQDYLSKGYEYANLGEYELAISNFKLALLYDNKDFTTYYNIGLSYFYLEQYEEALNYLNISIDLEPAYFASYSQRGILYSITDEFESAELDFQKCIEIDSSNSTGYYNLGINYLRQNRISDAIDFLEIADEKGHPNARSVIENYCR